MLMDLHGIVIAFESPDTLLLKRWAESFASRPRLSERHAGITFALRLVPSVPPAPQTEPIYAQADLLSVHAAPDRRTILHFPRFGQLSVDLGAGRTSGDIVAGALSTYGVLEDLCAMGLTAHLRRRGFFPIHAFAAALEGRALLLVGAIGSGKTTTGISLLRSGWKLLSNDSPLLQDEGRMTTDVLYAYAYPGLVSAYMDTLRRFPELAGLAPPPAIAGAPKVSFAAESVYPDAWIESAPVSAIVFPRVAHRGAHALAPLSEADALRGLLPHAIDRWDAEMIPAHLQLLRSLVGRAPAYALDLGENIEGLPDLLKEVING